MVQKEQTSASWIWRSGDTIIEINHTPLYEVQWTAKINTDLQLTACDGESREEFFVLLLRKLIDISDGYLELMNEADNEINYQKNIDDNELSEM